jgi:hypothetical protein
LLSCVRWLQKARKAGDGGEQEAEPEEEEEEEVGWLVTLCIPAGCPARRCPPPPLIAAG